MTSQCAATDYPCVVAFCSGYQLSGERLFNYWNENFCLDAYSVFINSPPGRGNPTNILQYNQESMDSAQDAVVNLFNTYFKTNTLTDNITSPEYNNFQEKLLELCTDPRLPGICQKFLSTYCSQFSRDEAIASETLTNFCGCYVPPDPDYLQYTLGTLPCLTGSPGCFSCPVGTTGCTGQPSCDPLCRRAKTSRKANIQSGQPITCPQTVCVIDNSVISVENSRIPGGINLNSVCSGCNLTSGGCLCVVAGTNISETASNIGLGVNFNQFCGPNSICLVEDSAGNIISQGACPDINSDEVPLPAFSSFPNFGITILSILFVLIVFFIILTAYFTS